jgi:hypothetical protein
MEPVTLVTQLLSLWKTIGDLASKRKDSELSREMLAVLPLFTQLQAEVLKLQNENAELRAEDSRSEEWRRIKGRLRFDGTVYWLEKDGQKDGPYCPTCADANERLVRLISSPTKVKGVLDCNVHKTSFYGQEYRAPGPAIAVVPGISRYLRNW